MVDLAIGVTVVVLNNRIQALLGEESLAVWGMITSVGTVVQTLGYATGESARAIESTAHGAGRPERAREALWVSSVAACCIGLVALAIGMVLPEQLARIYMDATPGVLSLVPGAVRRYFLAFPLLVPNVSSTYYFQAVGRPGTALGVSLLRGIALPVLMAYLLLALLGAGSLWLAVPVAEVLTLGFVLAQLREVRQG